MLKELNWRLNLLGLFCCILCAAATPYIVLKLGMSTDLSYGAMFLAAAILGNRYRGKELAIQLNIIQTMVGAVTGVGFMCVILGAFHYIQTVFGHDIGFHPTWWQVTIWITVSAYLGVFMSALTRSFVLEDETLPWPSGVAVLNVAETLTDPSAGEITLRRRTVLIMSTAFTAFVTFLKDGLGVITPMVANPSLKMMFSLEMAAIGLGMFIPLSVGLSSLLGVWIINQFGELVSRLGALSGTTTENWGQCTALLDKVGSMAGPDKADAMTFLQNHCGDAAKWVTASSHFSYMVKWFMWPATAMMIAASLTSVLVPLARDLLKKHDGAPRISRPYEKISWQWNVVGIIACILGLVALQSAWFNMPWQQVLVAVGMQPLLIIAGARVMAITGQGPVSLMTNATQFVFGLIWPQHIQQNLNAAHISADPQASSESTLASFWIARKLGGHFNTLIVCQLLVIPIGALLLVPVFNQLVHTYGIGPDGLTAPTSLKIASLAMVMEKGIIALPRGAYEASMIAALLGIVLELLLMKRRFSWLPIPAALGFALILPPPLTIALATGSVIAAIWKKFSPQEKGSYESYARPFAAGLVAGEALVGAILLPILATVMELIMKALK